MVIRQAFPGGYSLFAQLETDRRQPRLTRTGVIAIGVAGALHLGLIAYLYEQRFGGQLAPAAEPPVVTIETWSPPKPPPPMPTHQQKRQVDLHQPTDPLPRQQTDSPIPPQPPQPNTVATTTTSDPGLGLTSKVTLTGPQEAVGPRVISQPQWLSRPSAEELSRAYPPRALDLNRNGQVMLQCLVAANGGLTGCQVASETPAGFGFGAAAISLSKRFRMSPRTEDGRPVDGAVVRIPLAFSLG